MIRVALLILGTAVGCTKRNVVECDGNETCVAFPGGECRVNGATGSQWCAYPDALCASGMRWSEANTGDDLAGMCVDPTTSDADAGCVQRLGWVSARDGDEDIYIGALDGSGQTDITQSSVDELAPNWSRTTDRIAYSRTNGAEVQIWVIGTDGSDPHAVTSAGSDISPRWSPDGMRIAFTRVTPVVHIWTVGADGTGVDELSTDMAATDSLPTWSPDGSQIAFMSTRTGGREIWSANPDGSGAARLTIGANASPDFFAFPEWSPDGAQILYIAGSPTDIWIMDANGSNPQNLTQSTMHDEVNPRWLMNGSRIIFERRGQPSTSIYAMNPDGTGQSLLVENASSPEVSPDGTRMAWVSERDGNAEVYVSDIDGSNPTRITTGPETDNQPAWPSCR